MQIEEDNKMISVHFDSILNLIEGDFNKNLNSREIKEYLGDNIVPKRQYEQTNSTYKDLINHALIGDGILLQDLQSKISILEKVTGKNTLDHDQRVQVTKRKRMFSDYGDELDIEKIYNGDLDHCWSKTERIVFDSNHRFITLYIENGANWSQNVEDSFWRSAIAVLLTKELELAGKSVRIIVGSCVENSYATSNKKMTQSMTVKEYNQRVHLSRVAAMTHLGFFRTVSFAMINIPNYKTNSSLGSHSKTTKETFPIQLQKQIKKGHTKIVHVKAINNKNDAIKALEYCYEQILENSK